MLDQKGHSDLKVVSEIDLTSDEHETITSLRNASFPDHRVLRSYFKQLPNYRLLNYQAKMLVGYMGLDHRAIGINGVPLKVLGIIDFCVAKKSRGIGIGSAMLQFVHEFALKKNVDFLMLISERGTIYRNNGFQNIETEHSWLKVHDHQNHGVASERISEFYIKPIQSTNWPSGKVDWLGYIY